jgi:hypothetical protein
MGCGVFSRVARRRQWYSRSLILGASPHVAIGLLGAVAHFPTHWIRD